jgi:anaplastic lymphoma kinase
LADFGFARFRSNDLAQTINIGSPLFMAPELKDRDAYSFPVDVFAYAVTVVWTFSTTPRLTAGLVREREEIGRRIGAGERLVRPKGIPDTLWTMVVQAWHPAPEQRPTFSEIAQRFIDDPTMWIPGTDAARFEEYRQRVYHDVQPPAPLSPSQDKPIDFKRR